MQKFSKSYKPYKTPAAKHSKRVRPRWQEAVTVIILAIIFSLMLQTPTLAQSPLSHSLNVFLHYENDPGKDIHLLLPWQDSEFPLLPIAQLAQWSDTNLSWQKAGTSGAAVWGNEILGLVLIPESTTIRVVNGAKSQTPSLYRYEWLETPELIEGRLYLPLSVLDLMNISYTMDAANNAIHLYFPEETHGNGNCNAIWQAVKAEATAELAPPKPLASFTTYYNEEEQNRSTNLVLAAQSLNGLAIAPNAEFSFNAAVGPRTPARGYSKAIIFVGNKKVLDYGGGVCQVSTTLYRAAKAAHLQILERHSHSLPVPYAVRGQDATVAWGSKDLRFKNDTKHILTVKTSAQNGTLTISLFTE